MSSRRITIDARMIGSSGIGTYLQGLLSGLRLQPDAALSFSLLGNQADIPQGPWSVQPASSRVYSLSEQWEVPHASGRIGTDLLHSPHYNLPVLMASQTVVTVHDLIHLKFPQFWPSLIARAYARFFFHQVIPKARAILTVSENTKRDLVEMLSIPADRITVTYPAVDHARFASADTGSLAELKTLGLPENYLLYIGNLKEFKNVPKLVEAYLRLRAQIKEAPPLVLVGRNFIPGFENTLAGIPGIHWLGEMRRELLPCLYQNALLFIFPSLYEGFGLPPLEAMASGTPVLCSNRASLPEVVGNAALMMDPDNIEQMADAMRRLIENESLRKDLSAKGLKQAALFSWERMANQTLAVYKRCLA